MFLFLPVAHLMFIFHIGGSENKTFEYLRNHVTVLSH
jgi:hypothetical protein